MIKKIFYSVVVSILVLSSFLHASDALAYKIPAMVTFTFDDGDKSIYSTAAPILGNYHMPAVYFGETGPLNAGEDWIMTWEQVKKLRDKYGWEIGSHSVSHPYLTQVSDEQLIQEVEGSKQDFAAQGIDVKTFATPYGDYNPKVLSVIARYYESQRAAWGGPNVWLSKYNDYEIVTKEVTNTTTPRQVSNWVNTAINRNQWLVLLFHKIVPGKALPYEYNISNLQQVVNDIITKPIKTVTITEGLRYSDQPNLILNPNFSDLDAKDWAQNWTRNNETNVLIDKANHGNVFGSDNSLKIVGGTEQNEAVTGMINVTGTQEYILRMYQNVQDLAAGGWAVYINEFRANGTWIKGRWMGGNYSNFVGYRYYQYKPSSAAVAKIDIRIYTEPNSQMTLYTDSVELKAPILSGSSPVVINPAPAPLVSQSEPVQIIGTELTGG